LRAIARKNGNADPSNRSLAPRKKQGFCGKGLHSELSSHYDSVFPKLLLILVESPVMLKKSLVAAAVAAVISVPAFAIATTATPTTSATPATAATATQGQGVNVAMNDDKAGREQDRAEHRHHRKEERKEHHKEWKKHHEHHDGQAPGK
jgi:hypothetical protein